MTKQISSQQLSLKNSTCRLCGHDWQAIASNYRMCKRPRCHASERLMNGTWVSNAPAYRRHTPVVASEHKSSQSAQSSMWDASSSTTQSRKDR